MLTSIGTIAGAITALIGVGWAIKKYLDNRKLKKQNDSSEELAKRMIEATTDEERKKLSKELSNLANGRSE